MFIGAKLFTRGFTVLAITGLLISGEAFGQSDDTSREIVQPSVAVTEYCEQFARKYFHEHANRYLENSTKTKKILDVHRWISNLFSPSDSRFTSGYKCKFQTMNANGESQQFTVSLFLTNTLSFAEYTQWEDLQVLPIKYVVDSDNNRSGYGVFKYFEAD